jgi:perosamine synthetase
MFNNSGGTGMTLAIWGGQPVIEDMNNAHLPYPIVGPREHEFVTRALNSGELWGPFAPMTVELEKRWAAYVGTDFSIAMNSGTAALHSAVAASGIQPNDHVIVPAYTFIASASCVLMSNAIPVFCDVDATTLNMTPETLEAAITPQTKAVIPVHLYGLPCDMDGIMDVAARYRLNVIEDCSQAHGARINGRHVGSYGIASVFSLNASKTLAGPEGGLLNTSSVDLLNRAGMIRVFGSKWEEGQLRERDADCIGYNYRTHELSAAFALAQLMDFDNQTERRIANAHYLADGLSGLPGIELPRVISNRGHVYQMFRVGVDPQSFSDRPLSNAQVSAFRDAFVAALRAEGCKWSVWERKVLPDYNLFQTKNALFSGVPWSNGDDTARNLVYDGSQFPNAQKVAANSLCTTAHYPQHDQVLLSRYVDAFQKVWAQREKLLEQSLAPKGL